MTAHIFALSSTAELATLLGVVFGAFGTILVGFYRYANSRENTFERAREADREAFEKSISKLVKTLNNNAKSNQKIASVMEQGNREAAERNGHLGDQNVEIIKISKEISQSIKKIPQQNVHEQRVKHQTVELKD